MSTPLPFEPAVYGTGSYDSEALGDPAAAQACRDVLDAGAKAWADGRSYIHLFLCPSYCTALGGRGLPLEVAQCSTPTDKLHTENRIIHPSSSAECLRYSICPYTQIPAAPHGKRCPMLDGKPCNLVHKIGCIGGLGDVGFRMLLQKEDHQLPEAYNCVLHPDMMKHDLLAPWRSTPNPVAQGRFMYLLDLLHQGKFDPAVIQARLAPQTTANYKRHTKQEAAKRAPVKNDNPFECFDLLDVKEDAASESDESETSHHASSSTGQASAGGITSQHSAQTAASKASASSNGYTWQQAPARPSSHAGAQQPGGAGWGRPTPQTTPQTTPQDRPAAAVPVPVALPVGRATPQNTSQDRGAAAVPVREPIRLAQPPPFEQLRAAEESFSPPLPTPFRPPAAAAAAAAVPVALPSPQPGNAQHSAARPQPAVSKENGSSKHQPSKEEACTMWTTSYEGADWINVNISTVEPPAEAQIMGLAGSVAAALGPTIQRNGLQGHFLCLRMLQHRPDSVPKVFRLSEAQERTFITVLQWETSKHISGDTPLAWLEGDGACFSA